MDSANDSTSRPGDELPVRYPEHRMLAVIDGPERLHAAVRALTGGGFLASEVEVLHGAEAARRLREETGRTGFADLAMRLIESIGLPNDELALKNRYADALASGCFLVSVLAPTEDRQRAAARLLREHGGEAIHFFDRYTITTPERAD